MKRMPISATNSAKNFRAKSAPHIKNSVGFGSMRGGYRL